MEDELLPSVRLAFGGRADLHPLLLGLRAEGFVMRLVPKLTDSLDRIVFYTTYRVKERYRDSVELIEFANSLNAPMNNGKFYIDVDGTFEFETQVTFFDRVEDDDLSAWLEWVTDGLGLVIVVEGERFRKYLE